MAKIKKIKKGSIAFKIGLEAGDKIISINGKKIDDYIDYQYETAEPFFTLKIKKSDGEIKEFEVERKYNELLGITLDGIIYDKLKKCNNDCVFCFVKQQPSNLRNSLLLKDDDYRFSFLKGSFITLSNLLEKDWEKIISKRLSPLYISVHTTNPDLRKKMMKNPRAGNIIKDLKRLKNNNINFHAQLVLCPGLNDSVELKNTLKDLEKFKPNLLSLGVVPVGLTKFRDGLEDLDTYDKKGASKVLKIIHDYQNKFKNKYNENFLFASDEFYLLADKKIPEYKEYNDFPQIENGIGLTRLLWNELNNIDSNLPAKLDQNKKITIVTSVLAEKVMRRVIKRFNKIRNLEINLLIVENEFFGKSVTVTGLLTGQDIYNKIIKNNTANNIILPGVTLNDDFLFLDDMSFNELKNKLSNKNLFVCDNLKEIMEVL
ncbi:MAG: DUF512 domain-containing protein [Bacillota bacterium]